MFKSWLLAALAAAALFAISPVMAQDDEGSGDAASEFGAPATAEADATVIPIAFTRGGDLLQEPFSGDDVWERYTDDRGVDFGVDKGEYRMHMPSELADSYVWGLNATRHEDVIIEAKFALESGDSGTAYGLMCRADTENNGNGYYFLVSAEGFGYIGKAYAGVDSVEPISDQVDSDAIRTGSASNQIRAVCIGNYLALYVNSKLVARANDDEFTGGFAGLASSSGEDEDSDVLVDDLSITEAIARSDVETESPVLPELQGVSAGEVLDQYDFANSDDWPSFTEDSGLDMGIADGAYHIHVPASLSGEYIWTTGTAANDVIINVRASLIDGPVNSVYGVMCRVDDTEKGTGYFLSIAGDGYYTIERVAYRNGEFDVTQLVDWTPSSVIRQGYASNDITGVCSGSYLALYVNGELLAEAHDTRFTGDVYAIDAGLSEEADLNVKFDDLTIYAAETN